MAVTIRMQRRGCKNRPFYRLVVTDARQRRSGKYIEALGFFDPITKTEKVAPRERYEHWIGQGAECSSAVEHVLNRHYAGLVVPKGVRKAK